MLSWCGKSQGVLADVVEPFETGGDDEQGCRSSVVVDVVVVVL